MYMMPIRFTLLQPGAHWIEPEKNNLSTSITVYLEVTWCFLGVQPETYCQLVHTEFFFFFFFFMVKCSTNKQELCTTVDFSIHLEFHLKNSTITLSKCLSHYLNACKLNRCFFPKETHGSKTKRTGQPVLLQ